MEAIIDDAGDAFALAGRRAQPDDLAALSERYGLSPAETAAIVVAAGLPIELAVAVIDHRCEHDPTATVPLAARYLAVSEAEVTMILDGVDMLPGAAIDGHTVVSADPRRNGADPAERAAAAAGAVGFDDSAVAAEVPEPDGYPTEPPGIELEHLP